MKRYVRLAGREYTFNQRLLAMVPAGIVFVYLIPVTLIKQGPRLDAVLNFPHLSMGALNYLVGSILILLGAFYGFWSIISQFVQARGTPLPVMPTQKLLVSGPFKQCRNPMTFGTLVLYLGIGMTVGSISALVLVIIFGSLLFTYIKLLEERELELRFGQDYLEYKARTPFIIPRITNTERSENL